MTCCVAIDVAGHPLTQQERITLTQYRTVFSTRDIILFCPAGYPWREEYEHILKPSRTVLMPVAAVADDSARSVFRLSPEYYDTFSDYDYVLVCSLRTWPLYDALDWWTEQGYDYIAAPWLNIGGCRSKWIRGLDVPGGGCSSGSLRNVRNLREFTRHILTNNADDFVLSEHDISEEVLLSGGLPPNAAASIQQLSRYPRSEQARFAWGCPSMPDEDGNVSVHRSDIRTLQAITRGRLPMLITDPDRTVHNRFCIPDSAPGSVFLFSSAVKPEYDYKRLIDSVEPDPAKRLLVFMNNCNAFRENSSGLELINSQKKIVTVHNAAGQEPFGPAAFGEIPLALHDLGYSGRHDSYTVHWRPFMSRYRPDATYDGEILASRETEVLRRIGSEVRFGCPTAGYMTYKIMRDKYPSAKIYLVNFFGAKNGFWVADVHDTDWEQAEYRKDSDLSFIFTE